MTTSRGVSPTLFRMWLLHKPSAEGSRGANSLAGLCDLLWAILHSDCVSLPRRSTPAPGRRPLPKQTWKIKKKEKRDHQHGLVHLGSPQRARGSFPHHLQSGNPTERRTYRLNPPSDPEPSFFQRRRRKKTSTQDELMKQEIK